MSARAWESKWSSQVEQQVTVEITLIRGRKEQRRGLKRAKERGGKEEGRSKEEERHTLAKPPAKPNPIPPNNPGAAKNATPLPSVPNIEPPSRAATPPTAAYFAYRIRRRIMYRRTYLISVLLLFLCPWWVYFAITLIITYRPLPCTWEMEQVRE
jgi:hypothetical protein